MSRFKDAFSDDDSIEAMAAAWLAQRDDQLSPDKETEFMLWRQADPRHEAAVARLEAAWAGLQELRHFRPEAAAHPDRDLLAPAPKRRPAWAPLIAWAAAALVAVTLGAEGWMRLRAYRSVQSYSTTADGYQRVALSDGSIAELNTSTDVRVAYSPAERRVRLLRGEAHFTVAKNKERPFWVEAGSVAVRAVGTAFDVRMTDREVDVLVTEGKVTLAQSSGAARDPAFLAAGQRAVIATEGGGAPSIETASAGDIRSALAWEGPRLIFVATPLSSAVNQFNRYNAAQIELADPSIGALPISGSFRPENVEGFVRLLAQGGDIAAEFPAPNRILLRKRQ